MKTAASNNGEVRRHWAAQRVVDIGVVGIGFLIGGVGGAVIAAAALWISREDPGRPVAFAALVMLGVAAIATVVESPPNAHSLNPSFAHSRPVAALAARASGVLLLVALVQLARLERVRLRKW
jgi:hypothetical protein